VDGMICVIVEHFNRFCYLLIQAGSFRGRGYTFSLPNLITTADRKSFITVPCTRLFMYK